MKRADGSNAPVAVIIGDDEAAAGTATVKPLRATAEQRRVSLDELADAVGDLIFEMDDDHGGI
jgi:histidyl-tRNA synthetase